MNWYKAVLIVGAALITVFAAFGQPQQLARYGGAAGILSILSLWVLVWYTIETQQMRQAAQDQADSAQKQVEAMAS